MNAKSCDSDKFILDVVAPALRRREVGLKTITTSETRVAIPLKLIVVVHHLKKLMKLTT